jgi:hypothetical protein
MGKAGRAMVLKNHAWSTIVDRWLEEIGAGDRPVAEVATAE